MTEKHPVEKLADAVGGKIDAGGILPDGSGWATMSMPLPKGHWLTKDGYDEPPMPFRIGSLDPPKMNMTREMWAAAIRKAGKYAIRASTMNGKEVDFDPDAMLQNLVVGMLGYWTTDGMSGSPLGG